MSANKLLYIIMQAPYSNAAGQEALDAILIGAALEQKISVLFLHDGVFQILGGQQVDAREDSLKQFTKTYQALADFGVENLYVLSSSLSARGIQTKELIVEPSVLDDSAVSDLISQQYRVFTF